MKHFTLVNLKKKKVGQGGFDFNKRIIISFREIGKGYSELEDFCGVMSMPPPMAKTTYYKHIPSIHEAYVTTAPESMKNAVNELKEGIPQMLDIDLSVDGTWQRRGHASLNGVTTGGFLYIFISGTKHTREDNPDLYCWVGMTGLHAQTFNI